MQYKIEGIKSANKMEVKRVCILKKGISVVRQLGQKSGDREGCKVISKLKANLHFQPYIGCSEINILSNFLISPLKFIETLLYFFKT